jgi:hypothetical protein
MTSKFILLHCVSTAALLADGESYSRKGGCLVTAQLLVPKYNFPASNMLHRTTAGFFQPVRSHPVVGLTPARTAEPLNIESLCPT